MVEKGLVELFATDLLVLVDGDLAVLPGDGGELDADVASLVAAEQARLVDEREDGAVGAGALDHHDRAVERHLRLFLLFLLH